MICNKKCCHLTKQLRNKNKVTSSPIDFYFFLTLILSREKNLQVNRIHGGTRIKIKSKHISAYCRVLAASANRQY